MPTISKKKQRRLRILGRALPQAMLIGDMDNPHSQFVFSRINTRNGRVGIIDGEFQNICRTLFGPQEEYLWIDKANMIDSAIHWIPVADSDNALDTIIRREEAHYTLTINVGSGRVCLYQHLPKINIVASLELIPLTHIVNNAATLFGAAYFEKLETDVKKKWSQFFNVYGFDPGDTPEEQAQALTSIIDINGTHCIADLANHVGDKIAYRLCIGIVEQRGFRHEQTYPKKKKPAPCPKPVSSKKPTSCHPNNPYRYVSSDTTP